MPSDNTMIPGHLDLPWRIITEDGVTCVVTDVRRGGPFYYICHIVGCLPGDDSGRKAAQYICDCHNNELKQRKQEKTDENGKD